MKPSILYVFDIDDTLLWTSARTIVKHNGVVVARLTCRQYAEHTLPDGHEYDYTEFRNAQMFHDESVPVGPVMEKIRQLQQQIDGTTSKIIMNTAREDLDDKDTVLATFERFGLDMSKIHVHRAGSMPGDLHMAEKKMVFIKRYLHIHPYDEVHMYEDSLTNLKVFSKMPELFPNTKFIGWLVDESGNATVFEQ